VRSENFEVQGLRAKFEQDLERLKHLVEARDRVGALALLREMVIRY
jgi:hypothetical protein